MASDAFLRYSTRSSYVELTNIRIAIAQPFSKSTPSSPRTYAVLARFASSWVARWPSSRVTGNAEVPPEPGGPEVGFEDTRNPCVALASANLAASHTQTGTA